MPFTVNMPKLSPTMETGNIAHWVKKEGEFVEEGDVILEIATDKATVEHRALDAGWLRKILVAQGEDATVNAPLAIFTEEKEESIEGFEVPKKTLSPQESSEKKESVSQESPQTVVASQQASHSETVNHIPLPPLEKLPPRRSKELRASPLAKKQATEQGLDLSTVKGSGPGGRIVSADLEKAQAQAFVSFPQMPEPTILAGSYKEVKLSPIRKVVAKRLQESKSFIPHFYLKQTVRADELVAVRNQLKELGHKVTFNDLVIRACALALKKHPDVNVGFHSQNQTIVQFETIDISVAVSFDGGLITPIIRHADHKNLGELSLEMKSLIKKAQAGKLEEHEYKGGSFCVSNLGMFGLTEFCAVINPPQAAILAVGGIQSVPVVEGNRIVPGQQMHLTLSCDHRVIDGALGAQFLQTMKKLLETPAALILV